MKPPFVAPSWGPEEQPQRGTWHGACPAHSPVTPAESDAETLAPSKRWQDPFGTVDTCCGQVSAQGLGNPYRDFD